MILRQVKLTKDNKCAMCGHELKANWTAYTDGKQVYCNFCAVREDERSTPAEIETLQMLRIIYNQGKPTDTSEPETTESLF